MEDYSIFNDFESYIKENEAFINYLHTSLLNDLVVPIIKTLVYLENLNQEEELSKENYDIFEFGFQYLFENLEQLKLYLRQLKDNYETFENKSIFIKMIFQLEEFKVELQKREHDEEIKSDLKKIDEAINFFEDHINTDIINKNLLEEYIDFYYEIEAQYDDVLLMSDAFSEYCASYGI